MKWTQEHYDYILAICNGKSYKEILDLFNERFNKNISFYSFKNAMYRCGARTNFNGGCFPKGHKPFNKGLKWDEYLSKETQEKMLQTSFTKGSTSGDKSYKWLEIGTETPFKDGYIYVKTDKPIGTKGRRYQVLKHHLIWQEHYGPIPEGCAVIFLDGDNQNFDIDNLALVKRSELLKLNQEKLIVKGSKEATQCGITIVKIEERIKEHEKQANKS